MSTAPVQETTAPDTAPAEAAPDAAPRAPRAATPTERAREAAHAALVHARRAARVVGEVVQPLGWVVLGLAVLLWLAAATFGWLEALVGASVATAVALLCVLFLFGRTTYEVDLDLTRTRVVAGESAVGALLLANRTPRALLPAEVVLPVGSGRGVFQVPRLAAGESHEELFSIPTARRGVLAVGPVSVLRGDPLGLFERTHDRRQAVDLYVHPRTVGLEGLSLGQMRDLEGLPDRHLARDDVSFHALREYQPGDDLRHVHWKSTARVGDVMVREYEQTRRSHFVLALSTHPGEYRDPDEFEIAVSAAGSIGLRALRDSRMLDARVPAGPLRTRDGRRFLDALSALEHSKPREGGVVALAGAVAAHAPDAAIAVLLCGSAVSAADLRLACSRIPDGVRVLAVVADSRLESAELRRVGQTDVISIGDLSHLPSAVRKVLS